MGFWQRLYARLVGDTTPGPINQAPGDPHGIWLHYRCGRCGAPVRVRADRTSDLNREDDGPGVYVLRKEVMDNRCFALMHSEVWFDSAFTVVASDVTGGSLISRAEFEALSAPSQGSKAE